MIEENNNNLHSTFMTPGLMIKRLSWLMLMLFLSIVNISAAFSDNNTVNENNPTLELVTKVLDFGIVNPGDIVSQTVEVFHRGEPDADPIVILNTSLDELDSSYFTADIYTPVTLYPGETSHFDVFFSVDSTQIETSALVHGNLFISHTGDRNILTVNMVVKVDTGIAPIQHKDNPAVGFGKATLNDTQSSRPTSLQFGPDSRLYVADMLGTINIYTVERIGSNNYKVTDTEVLQHIKNIPNHNDDGSLNATVTQRLVTGIVVSGTENNPVIYVASSDPRIGGGPQHTDTNLDTNSTIVSRLSWDGSSWEKLDLVRGLPRSEENHTGNGMVLSEDGTRLYLAFGGNTNAGATSNNFALLPEYALSAAILEINLATIGNSTYDLPTLDDEDRPGVNDLNDPFGGNQGKNQAKLLDSGPVKVYAPGFRNPYDVVIAKSGKMYSIDNGPNAGWGGVPNVEGAQGQCLNTQNEPGVTYHDALYYITGSGYYAGHPNPTRGNSNNKFNNSNPQSAVETANAVECDYRAPGVESGSLATFPVSTNGLTEYRASNFGNLMKGDLLAAGWNNKIFRIQLNQDGNGVVSSTDLFSNVGVRPLDVTSQGDQQVFPGTIWVADFSGNNIVVFEPNDFLNGTEFTCSAVSGSGDEDNDGFLNADELASGTDPCSAADIPSDFDGDFVSDSQDNDDDNDGIPDVNDPFALDSANGADTSIPLLYDWENNSSSPGGIFNLGFTGLMNNGSDDYFELYNPFEMTASGAAGVLTIDRVSSGDAYLGNNSQEYGFQLGINVSSSSPVFTVRTRIVAPFSGVTPQNFQSMGLFLGTGDQDNYVKLTVNTTGVTGGLQLFKEVKGNSISSQQLPEQIYGSDLVDLFLTVDPTIPQLTASYQVVRDGVKGAKIDFPGKVPFPKDWLTGPTKLAVGILSTSVGADPFPGTWDFFEVQVEVTPTILDDGDPSQDQPTTVSVTADPVYRINVGGPTIESDSGDWASDDSAKQYVNTGNLYKKNAVIDVSQSGLTAPQKLFTSERWDAGSQPEMNWSLPVNPGNYEVRLYFAEIWSGAYGIGKRVFTANVEGTQLDDIDVFAQAGSNTAVMHSVVVTSDDVINIDFQHIIQNPSLKGIEILPVVTSGNKQPTVNAGADINMALSGNVNLSAVVSDDGLPTGNLDIVWTKISGPGAVSFGSHTEASSSVTFSSSGEYTLRISVNDGEFTSTDEISISVDPDPTPDLDPTPDPVEQLLMRINVGGPLISDSTGDWLSDAETSQYVNTGKKYSRNVTVDTSGLDSVVPQTVFQSERWDAGSQPEMKWSIPVTPGNYRVNLYFAEIWSGAYSVGKRIFSAQVENERVQDIDIFSEVGKNTALKQSYVVSADNMLNIELFHKKENPAIKGIEIISLSNATQDPMQTPVSNTAPNVNAGSNRTAIVNNPITMNAQVTDDALPTSTLSYSWSKVSGSGVVKFSSATILQPSVTFSQAGLYELRLTVSDGDLSSTDNLTITIENNDVPDTGEEDTSVDVIRINVGGPEVSDTNGNWMSDSSTQSYVNTGILYSKNVAINRSTLTSSVPQAVFQSERWDPASTPEMKWTIPVVPGNYEVRLYFAEIWPGAFSVGKRIFSVNVEGTQLNNIDIYSEVGKNTALEYLAVVNADNNIDIQFQHIVQNPALMGIEIIALDVDDGAAPPKEDPTNNAENIEQRLNAATPWAAVEGANLSEPTARHEAGAVVVNGNLYLMGGRGNRPVNKYNPLTGVWSEISNMPRFMHHFQPVVIGTKIHVIGAFGCCYPIEESIGNIYIFDTTTDLWSQGPAIPAERLRGSAGAVVRNGKIYLIGGNTQGHSGGSVAQFDEYNPATNEWKSMPTAPSARDHFNAVLVGNKLVAAGGRQTSQQPSVFGNTLATVDIFDFTSGVWSTSAQKIPTQRAGTMAVNVGNEAIIIGGESNAITLAHTNVEAFNPFTGQWRQLQPLITGRHSGGAAVLADGIHVVSGNIVRGGGAESSKHEKLDYE